MKNPILDKQHIREYLVYGSIAAILFVLPVAFFLYNNIFQNIYLLFVGSALFMMTIFSYAFKLLYRQYEAKRAISMLIAGHLATLVGVTLSVIFMSILFFVFFPHAFQATAPDNIIKSMPGSLRAKRPISLLVLLFGYTCFVNFSVGSFTSIITAYVGKRNQTTNTPTSLDNHLAPEDI